MIDFDHRDLIAIVALLCMAVGGDKRSAKTIAEQSYAIADAMLVARAKKAK